MVDGDESLAVDKQKTDTSVVPGREHFGSAPIAGPRVIFVRPGGYPDIADIVRAILNRSVLKHHDECEYHFKGLTAHGIPGRVPTRVIPLQQIGRGGIR